MGSAALTPTAHTRRREVDQKFPNRNFCQQMSGQSELMPRSTKKMKLKEICRSLSQRVKSPMATPLREAMATSRRDLRLLYEVEERLLGKGGFGEVHAATRRSDGLRVAVKEVRRSSVPPYMMEEGLPLEVQLLQPVEGRDLFDYISERGPLEERLAGVLFKQVVESVAGCQERGVLHGDVKDENVLVQEDSNGEVRARLIDLGSGSWFSSEVYSQYEGTRVYAPPEWVAKDLISRCLTRDQAHRFNLAQVLAHPWLKEGPPMISKMNEGIRRNKRSFNLLNLDTLSSSCSSSSSCDSSS